MSVFRSCVRPFVSYVFISLAGSFFMYVCMCPWLLSLFLSVFLYVLLVHLL